MTSCVVFCLVSAGVHRKSLHSTLAGNGFGHEVSKRVASRDARLKSGRATRGCFYPTGGGLLPKAYRTVTVIVISSSLFACSDPDSSATTAALTPHEWEAQWTFFLVCFSRGSAGNRQKEEIARCLSYDDRAVKCAEIIEQL